MDTDKKLLELAAKAAGIEGWWSANDFCYGYKGNKNIPVPWNPLTDDGDALRLAATLRLNILASGADAFKCGKPRHVFSVEPKGTDPYAATRRAIVRAAAEIGKKK